MREHKVVILLRLLRTLVPRLDPTVPYVGDLLTNDRDHQVYDFLAAAGKLGRLFMGSGRVSADRVAVLHTAFDATVADPAFLNEAQKLPLVVAPVTWGEIASRVGGLFATPADIVARATSMSSDWNRILERVAPKFSLRCQRRGSTSKDPRFEEGTQIIPNPYQSTCTSPAL